MKIPLRTTKKTGIIATVGVLAVVGAAGFAYTYQSEPAPKPKVQAEELSTVTPEQLSAKGSPYLKQKVKVHGLIKKLDGNIFVITDTGGAHPVSIVLYSSKKSVSFDKYVGLNNPVATVTGTLKPVSELGKNAPQNFPTQFYVEAVTD